MDEVLKESTPYAERGVIYFSSVPRNMRPTEVRLHFNKYGTITRMRFVPYPKKERRPGGPLLPLQFKEGWIEFDRASAAQAAAACMNGTPVECKRQRKCYAQLWMVRYLDGFRWDFLAEAREEARRTRKAAEAEARRAEKETNEAYRRLVMQAHATRPQRPARREASTGKAMDQTKAGLGKRARDALSEKAATRAQGVTSTKKKRRRDSETDVA